MAVLLLLPVAASVPVAVSVLVAGVHGGLSRASRASRVNQLSRVSRVVVV